MVENGHMSLQKVYIIGKRAIPPFRSHLQCWRCSALMRTIATDGTETFQNWNGRTFYLGGVSFLTSTTRGELTYFFVGMLESKIQSWLVNIDFHSVEEVWYFVQSIRTSEENQFIGRKGAESVTES